MNIYAWALTSYAEQVRQAFKGRPLTKAQFAAAVSFHWNTGAIKRASWVKYWLRGDDARAKAAFMNWVTPSEIAKRINVEDELRAAFAGTPTAVLDQAPEPDAVPPAPTRASIDRLREQLINRPL